MATKRHEKAQKSERVGHEIFFNKEGRCPEINEPAGFGAREPEIAQQLRDMLVDDSPCGLELNDETILDNKVGKKLSQRRAIFIQNVHWKFLLNGKPGLPQSMSQSVFIDLFDVAVAMEAVNGETGFAKDVAPWVDGIWGHALGVLSRASSWPFILLA